MENLLFSGGNPRNPYIILQKTTQHSQTMDYITNRKPPVWGTGPLQFLLGAKSPGRPLHRDASGSPLVWNAILLVRLIGQYCFAHWRLSSVVCRLSSSVTLPAGGRAGRQRACGRLGGRHCTAGQYGYVPLGRHLGSTDKRRRRRWWRWWWCSANIRLMTRCCASLCADGCCCCCCWETHGKTSSFSDRLRTAIRRLRPRLMVSSTFRLSFLFYEQPLSSVCRRGIIGHSPRAY